MKVKCTSNSGSALSPKYLALGNSPKSEFNLLVDRTYDVFAIAVWKSVLLFLVADESDLPNWYPVDLFTVTDESLPSNWYFSRRVANEHGVEAIWGYRKLATSTAHYEGLLERDPTELGSFYDAMHKALESQPDEG